MTERQEKILELYKGGMKPVDIQRELGINYIQQVYDTIHRLRAKGKLPTKNDKE